MEIVLEFILEFLFEGLEMAAVSKKCPRAVRIGCAIALMLFYVAVVVGIATLGVCMFLEHKWAGAFLLAISLFCIAALVSLLKKYFFK